ncbi:MAG: hypothetical protein ACOCQ3_05165 [Natronomonas sp.]
MPTPQTNAKLTVDIPTRAADDNQGLVDTTIDEVLLPSLDDGLTLLDVEGERGVAVVQSLVVDHLLMHNGPAFWIDSKGFATTATFHRITPSQRLLDRVHVARAFTPFQHYTAIDDLLAVVDRTIQTALENAPRTSGARALEGEVTPSLLVVPALDYQYRDDALARDHANTLLARTLARMRQYAAAYDVPVLVTRTRMDGFTAPIERAVDHELVCAQTKQGPRFTGEEFETLVYPVSGGLYQTTFAYWRQVLGERARQAEIELGGASRDSGVDGPSISVDPLVDAIGPRL